MEAFFTTDALISLLTLTLLEVVLGIDNIIFITIVAGKLPASQRKKAQNQGLLIALVLRVALLFAISWVIGLKQDLLTLWGHGFSGRDLILLGGGLFLLYSTTKEIHHKLEGETEDLPSGEKSSKATITFGGALVQIALLNIIFSFDSVLTAVGLVKEIPIMIAAVVASTLIMIAFASKIGDFVNNHPSIKILALSFLLMIGTLLVAEAFHYEIPKGYAYFAMAFSFLVELLNMKLDKNTKEGPIKLRERVN
ncbi:TerC family protein [Dyadobacter arcticus]|uniref:Tellurium resistance membrane protein TerC n=1 Tax=Dyadobacter arcticus TaxID=1078754 RepID=A0ABX0UUB4_9BACT|nr:TerC family protein [Dyadobacter arcticus]NIJ55340.1 putative tellurium resistance membrane protein TerC [Dyadobacter arcticus]